MRDFEKAAGRAAAAELQCRMLLNKRANTKADSFAKSYSQVVDSIIKHYKADLTADEIAAIERSKQLRNKVLHSEMMELAGLSQEPVVEVKTLTLPSDNASDILAAIKGAADGTIPTTNVSAGMGNKDNIVGWFIQNGVSGVYKECFEIFTIVINVSTRLAYKY